MNVRNYIDLCQGNFGRKVACTDVQAITLQNVVKVLGNAIGTHNYNRTFIKYLYDYYKGDQPILYRKKIVRPEINNRVCENHALETVRFKAGQTYGEPIQYVCKKKRATEELNEQIDLFNDYLDEANAEARNIELGTYQSAVGTAYKAILREDEWGEGKDIVPFRIFIPSPMNTFVVYSSNNGKPMMSVQELKDIDGNQYYQCYSKDRYFIVQNGKVKDYGINGFDGIPIVEYPNNAERLSDIEICITMFDTINTMQSNRMDGIEQFVQSFMKFKNCEIDKDSMKEIAEIGAICVKSIGDKGDADVDILTAELNQSESQVAKDDIYKNMLIVEGMPNRESNTGGDTGQAVYLRNGWDFAEQRAKIDEPFVREAEKQSARIILNIILKTTKDINISTKDFDVKITRNSTDNMLVKAQTLDYLIKNKIHPLIAIITCSLFGDPQKVYEMSKPYLDKLYTEGEIGNPQAEIQKAQNLLKTEKPVNEEVEE